MIYGITASEFAEVVAGPAALGSFDFVNGVYSWGASSLSASDVIDQTGWIGAGGISVPGSGAAGAEILYAAATAVLGACSWTLAIEIDLLSASSTTDLLTIANAGDAYSIQIIYNGGWQANSTDGMAAVFAGDYANSLSTGVHKVAVTRTDAKSVISVDGHAAQSDLTACTLPVIGFPMANFFLGGWDTYTDNAVKIRSLTIYDVQDDSVLPSLSA